MTPFDPKKPPAQRRDWLDPIKREPQQKKRMGDAKVRPLHPAAALVYSEEGTELVPIHAADIV